MTERTGQTDPAVTHRVMTAKRDFLELIDLDCDEIGDLMRLACRMKSGQYEEKPLADKTLAMIFRKSSTRTRVSFEVGTYQLGGHALFIADRDSQMGRGETISDTAKVLSGYVDGIVIRTFGQGEVKELAEHATVPVINGLTDLVHPCQLLADLMTLWEEFGPDLRSRSVAWIGDGNNMANSWINAAWSTGLRLRLACPEGYDPDPTLLARARERADVRLLRDPAEAAAGADVVTTDVWASMGQEEEVDARASAFSGYCVDKELMGRASPEVIFLHCLPAYRGKEVTGEVIDGPMSRVFPEAENRLHTQKALLVRLMG